MTVLSMVRLNLYPDLRLCNNFKCCVLRVCVCVSVYVCVCVYVQCVCVQQL